LDIRLEQLDASDFALELPASERAGDRAITLGKVGGLRGKLHVDPDVVRLDDTHADSGVVAAMSWPLRGGVLVVTEAPAALSSVELDLVSPRRGAGPLSLDARVGHLDAERVGLTSGSAALRCAIHGSAIQLSIAEGELSAGAATVGAADIDLTLGDLRLRGALSAGELKIQSHDGHTTVRATSASASELSLVTEHTTLILRGVELDGGIAIKGRDVRIDRAAVAEAEIEVSFPRRPPVEPEPPPPPEPPELDERPDTTPLPGGLPIPEGVDLRDDIVWNGALPIFDLRDLDRLAGKIEVGLVVNAQLPVVGKYNLARTFKIPIDDGALDFVEVERQLSTLEDAFIDFAVREGQLVLKRDIPLLPTRGKTLVSWPLSPVEQALAQNRVIRLRALPRIQVPRPKRDEKRATINEVRVEKPHVELTLNKAKSDAVEPEHPAAVSLNQLETLAVDGNLLFQAAENRRELEASALVRGLSLAVRNLAIGTRLLSGAEMILGELHVEFTEWDGFRPVKLVARARDLAIKGLTIRGDSRAATES
jgi:hypothetical protein